MIGKVFLALVGLMYAGLAIWCSVSPKATSEKVGFDLQPGNGESEFMTVYGGLEMGMAILFLLPLIRSDWLEFSLMSCLIIHACLVAFRTASLFMYSGVGGLTVNLAIGEWVILIASGAIYWWVTKSA